MAKDTFFHPNTTLNCRGNIIDLSTPKVMGILNITPDSFYDGGKINTSMDAMLSQANEMLEQGASFLDMGAVSARPFSTPVDQDTELTRLKEPLQQLRKTFPKALISVDTYRHEVARLAIEWGADLINDVSGGCFDPHMLPTIAQLQVPYILMHTSDTPEHMQNNPTYRNITVEMSQFFSQQLDKAHTLGIHDIILDVGFGFGKTLAHNYELLDNLPLFKLFEKPILVGISRKSMIYKPLNTTPQEALNGTTVGHTIALLKGATLLRVHDVKPAMEAITLTNLLSHA